jgi:hypothetical protein
MRQLFAPGADAILRLTLLVITLGGAIFLVVAATIARSDYMSGVGIAPKQPVPFSHKHHAGELGIDCRFCHTTVETQASAGLPPTEICMGCHSQIWTGAPMLAPVRDSLANNTPLQWTRVNQLPAYVYFNHAIHIGKGVGCSTCHGAIDTMQMTYRANAFHMDFCIACHRNPAPNLRTQDQVWNMEWTRPDDQATKGPSLFSKYHIRPAAQLTDCSICHR